MEAIILAGGLGTRLQGVIGAYPKCMADVNGKPFLAYILEYLSRQGCSKAILSLGFKHEVVTEWLGKQSLPFACEWVIEYEPLGTGGGIQLALKQAVTNDVVVLNGDTFFDINLGALAKFHFQHHAETSIALREMHNFERYGVVNTEEGNKILSFAEKRYMEQGLINGGVYFVNRKSFLSRDFPQKFSFEKDYLEQFVEEGKFFGSCIQDYFIDIGIPEDYARVQDDFKQMFP